MAYFDKKSKAKRKRQLRSAVARTAKAAKLGAKATGKEAARAVRDAREASRSADDPEVDTDAEEIELIRKILRNQEEMKMKLDGAPSGHGFGGEPDAEPGFSGDGEDFDYMGWL